MLVKPYDVAGELAVCLQVGNRSSTMSLLRFGIALGLHQMLLSVRHQKSGNSQAYL